jgi:acetyltransferase
MEQALDAPQKEVPHGLDAIFKPRNVAVIGATEKAGSVGRTIVWNLISNPFGGTVYPVNPNRPSVLGIRTYKNIAEIPDQIDLAVIVTPARTVPGLVQECVDAGIPGCIIISAGLRKLGRRGKRWNGKFSTSPKAKCGSSVPTASA